jgi:tetratricopeptide (TPR) repeat protein
MDLGRPQIAAAVARGLDFYTLLEVDRAADTHTIARRYRRLRAIFPDDPSRLKPDVARRLELLEVAGRVLTDPSLRQIYEELRSGSATPTTEVIRCSACAAPLTANATRCSFCGTAVNTTPMQASPPMASPPPDIEIHDYYALLGVIDDHLHPAPPISFNTNYGSLLSEREYEPRTPRPPTPEEVDTGALERMRSMLLQRGVSKEQHQQREQQLEVARRILRSDRLRPQYDALLMNIRQGKVGPQILEALHALEEQVRAEMLAEQGPQRIDSNQSERLIGQAEGLIKAGLPRDALPLLRQILRTANPPIKAHHLFAQATLASDDPLALGGMLLEQVKASLEASQAEPGLIALCKGLIARERGQAQQAATELLQAITLSPHLGVAWRGLAALALSCNQPEQALGYARQAAQIDRQDERPLLLIIAAAQKLHRRNEANEAAAQIAQIRGSDWDAASVLREFA